jgi:outer membrane protein TolC
MVLALSLLITTASAAPDNEAPVRLTFPEAAKVALGANPDLLQLRYQEESQRYRARQSLAPNNPVFSYNKNDIPGLTLGETGGSNVYQIQWTLGFPGKALSQSAANRHQADALRQQSSAKEIDILVALSNNYVSLTSNDKLYLFLESEKRKAEQLVKLLEKKYAAAQAAQADLLNARVVVANLEHDILENRNDYQLLLTQFRNLLKKPGETRFEPLLPETIETPKLTKSYDELRDLMLRNRHQLKAADAQLSATNAALTSASLSPLPDFQLTTGLNIYNVPGASPLSSVGINRTYSLGIGIVVPIFFPFNELSGIQAATRDRDAAEAAADSQRIQAQADLQSAVTGFHSATRAIENYLNLVLPAAKASYDLTLTTYSLGKADYFILNEARKIWVQAQKDLLAKQVSAAQLYNQIVQQVGCDVTSSEGPDVCH